MSEDRVVVITGASSGIGAGLAIGLGRDGFRLVLGARSQEKLRAVAEEAAPQGLALAVECDVTRRQNVEKLRDVALERFGRVDVWVNNAGRGILRPVLELTDEDIDEMMAVNLKSAVYGMQTIIPYFIERGRGHVINVSSALARFPNAPLRSAYNAAKAALNAVSANVRMDLNRQGANDVHVSVVMPGIVPTEFAVHAKYSRGPLAKLPSGALQPQSIDEVVQVMRHIIDEPRAEAFTNPAAAELVQRYIKDVGAFEAQL
ncbi:MAG TPA: SDR family oxidoreductase [Gemmatimonadaceae bacterium]|nr:SDR family oxidoreductase [Gemmatimonadaceae bacterium]